MSFESAKPIIPGCNVILHSKPRYTLRNYRLQLPKGIGEAINIQTVDLKGRRWWKTSWPNLPKAIYVAENVLMRVDDDPEDKEKEVSKTKKTPIPKKVVATPF